MHSHRNQLRGSTDVFICIMAWRLLSWTYNFFQCISFVFSSTMHIITLPHILPLQNPTFPQFISVKALLLLQLYLEYLDYTVHRGLLCMIQTSWMNFPKRAETNFVCVLQLYVPLIYSWHNPWLFFAGNPEGFAIDAYGRYVPTVDRFPSATGHQGLKPLCEKLAALGVVCGVHLVSGIPIRAVWEKTPILGTSVWVPLCASQHTWVSH